MLKTLKWIYQLGYEKGKHDERKEHREKLKREAAIEKMIQLV